MRTWLRDRGLLLANLALFVVFFGGMALTGVRVYNDEQVEHGGETVSLAGYLTHRGLRRGDVRELGERVPADGHLRAAHRLPVPARVVGVQADRRAGAAGRGPARACRRSERALAGAARRLGAEGLRELPGQRCSSCCSSAPGCCTPPAGPGPTARSSSRTAGQPVTTWAVHRHLAVLVRVVPELAERVPGRGGHRRCVGLPAAAGLARVEAGRRAARRRPGPDPVTRWWLSAGNVRKARAMSKDQYTLSDPTKLYADIDTKRQTHPARVWTPS